MIDLPLAEWARRVKARQHDGQQQLYDPVRRRFIARTPEEYVRQALLQYLLAGKGYSVNRLSVEKMVMVNGLSRRFDILIYDHQIQPWLLVECKAPQVALNDGTFRQAAAYNFALQAPYLAITNGVHTYCCSIDLEAKTYAFLRDFPDFEN